MEEQMVTEIDHHELINYILEIVVVAISVAQPHQVGICGLKKVRHVLVGGKKELLCFRQRMRIYCG